MMPIIVDKNFKQGWINRVDGNGTALVTNGVLKCTGSSADRSMKEYWIPVKEGQIVEVEIMARKISGEPRISMDLASQDGSVTILDYIKVKKEQWAWYKLRAVVPYNAGTKQFVKVILGKWSSVNQTTDGEFQAPVVKTDNGLGASITLACGLARLNKGVPTLEWNSGTSYWRNYGIANLEYNPTNKSLKVYLEHSLNNYMKPVVIVSGTNDSFEIPLAGKLVGGNSPYFEIMWSNGAQFLDISSKDLYVFINVFM
ncbi:hypothetical protein [Priestia megaterium]|uniref:hypothetical protein n=1 Tax=Priestia megaterium TaxID=1404 RepID=UPI000BFA8DFB|nr:hypothetical protein [Priestia megaterium]PFR91300.1 hypothetical protein COK39_22740 [Priestia megaterium]